MIKHFSELKIYQIAIKLAGEMDQFVKTIPGYLNIKDVKQIQESSSSIPSNIAEGFGCRFYPKKFLNFLINALGSSDETQNHLLLLSTKGYINKQISENYFRQYKNLSVRILNLINHLKNKHKIILKL